MWPFITLPLLGLDRYARHLACTEETVNANLPGVQWHHLENAGLAAGKLKDRPAAVTALHALGVAGLIACLLPHWGAKHGLEKLGASLLIAGGTSNLYDRLRRGTVTDMLRFPKAPGKLKQLVFNIADFMLVFGMILTVIGRVLRKK